MLSTPVCGWTDFQLDETVILGISYLNDIAFEWLDCCIFGLEHLTPFCVKGYLEPGRMLCTVSFWNCHVIVEYEENVPMNDEDIAAFSKCFHISMLDFSKMLYDDISSDIDGWAGFRGSDKNKDNSGKRKLLVEKLEKLKKLISESEEYFADGRGFF